MTNETAKRFGDRPIGVVTRSMEFDRIMKLPRRILDLSQVQDVTPLFERKKNQKVRFWPVQSAALIEAAKADGLFANITVGGGKTLICLALPEAMDAKRAVLLVKTELKRSLARAIKEFYAKHFILPLDRLTVVSYRDLSSQEHAGVLEDIKPDVIIADEGHTFGNRSSARTKRFLRYMIDHPECRFAVLSGTMTTRSVLDYAHLLELVLRKNSPLPRGYSELKDWSGALDVKPDYTMQPGVLRKLCKPDESIREGYQRRLADTEGVVLAGEDLGTSLVIKKLRPSVPKVIQDYIARVNKHWCLGDEELVTAVEKARALRQLSCGFYYEWDWPDGEPDHEWLEARSAWSKEVREKLTYARDGLDSPGLLAKAAERYFGWDRNGRKKPRPEPSWDSVTWPVWRTLRDRELPPTKAVWLSDFVVDRALKWAERARRKKARGIVWYWWSAVGERIAMKGRLPFFGPGTDAEEARAPVIVASIRAQGTGKNLQHRFDRNLIVSLPPNGTTFEQLAGRTHRPGQQADEVRIGWFGHTEILEQSMAAVIADAEYQESTTGQRQKVLYATHI